jgi:hypothetical protein
MYLFISLIISSLLQSPIGVPSTGDQRMVNNIILLRRWTAAAVLFPVAANWGLNINTGQVSLPTFVLFIINCIVLFFLVRFQAKAATIDPGLPQVQLQSQTPLLHISNIVSWVCFLSVYEYCTRVLLPQFFLDLNFRLIVSCILSIAVYSMLHLTQGLKMALLCIPFGIIALAWTIVSGSVLPAIILHLIPAVGFSYMLLYFKKAGI